MKLRHLFVLLPLLGGTAWGAAPARSSEPRSVAEAHRMLLVVAAEAREAEQLRQVAAELLGRLSVSIRAERVDRVDPDDIARAPSAGYLARVYIDLREPSRATLWFVDPAHDRILLRQLNRIPSGDELLREELGHILETSTEGLLSGVEIGLPRASVLPPARSKDTASPQDSPLATDKPLLQFALLYELQGLSDRVRLTHGPEASVYSALPPRRGAFGLWLTGQYRVPIHVETSSIAARIEGGALRALLTFDTWRTARFSLRSAAGGGADVLRLTPEAVATSSAIPAPSRTLTFPMLRVALALELRASSFLSLWSRAAVDFDVTGTHYVFEGSGGEQIILRPWTVRPALAIGAGFP